MNPETVSLDQILRVVRRRWWVVAQLVLAGIAAGALLAWTSPARYTATATALIESATTQDSGSAAPGRLSADAAARLVESSSVARRVARKLADGRSAGELLGAVTATSDPSGAFVDITAHDDDAAGAAQLANAFARQFIAARSETVSARLQQAVQAAEQELRQLPRGRQRSQLEARIAELRLEAAPGRIDAELIDPAVAGADDKDGALVRWAALGGGLGLLLGLVLVFALQALDPRVRALEEMRRLVRAPQLAAIPRARRRRRPKLAPVLAARAEPFEQLRGALLALGGDRELRRIMVTAPHDHEEGSASVAASLALSIARLGLRVCAVDADLRRTSLATEFGIEDTGGGLADALRGTPVAQVTQRFSVAPPASRNGHGPEPPVELSVVPGGSSGHSAAELLAGERIQELLSALEREHDVVIVNLAPLLTVGDALPLLEHASGTILVVRHAHSHRRAVARAAEMVTDAGGSLLGVVTTGVPAGEVAAEGYGPWPAAPAATARHGL